MRPTTVDSPWSRRLFWLGIAALALFATLQILALIEPFLIRMTAEPRPVTPRGDLAAEEQTNIEIFQRGHRAVLVGASSAHDLTVLRISVPIGRPPPVPIGRSADLKVGQKVLAIGNPFGLDYTLITGVISALDRSIQTSEHETLGHAIQTDAAINLGNSGGPLIDSAGRLIGINTAIYSPSGAYTGIGVDGEPVTSVAALLRVMAEREVGDRVTLGVLRRDDLLSIDVLLKRGRG